MFRTAISPTDSSGQNRRARAQSSLDVGDPTLGVIADNAKPDEESITQWKCNDLQCISNVLSINKRISWRNTIYRRCINDHVPKAFQKKYTAPAAEFSPSRSPKALKGFEISHHVAGVTIPSVIACKVLCERADS